MTVPNLRTNIYLIGDIDTQIYGNKLPSNLQVLKVLFFNLRDLKFKLRESLKLAIKEVTVFWEKACLPIQSEDRCIKRLEKLYKQWRNLQKRSQKPSNVEKEREFSSTLKNLFDISHGEVNNMVDDTKMEFLINQRKDGRVGYIKNIQTIYDIDDNAQVSKENILLERLEKSTRAKEVLGKFVLFNVLSVLK